MSNVPLLAAEGLRVDVEGAVAVEAATFTTHGSSVALVGESSGLLRAIAGTAAVRAGSLAVLGFDSGQRQHLAGVVGFAALDPPLPPKWTGREYLTWGARLSGMSRASARECATTTLKELELGKLATTPASSLSLAERRALVLAQAVVTKPAVLLASAPLAGLAGQDAAYVAAIFASTCKDRKWIVSLSNLYAGSEDTGVAARADELLVFASGRLVRQGKLERIEEGALSYTLVLRAKVDEFCEALRARGVEVSGGPRRFFVELPTDMKAADLIALSARIGAPIVELVPRILLT